jgi:hypothetical protein
VLLLFFRLIIAIFVGVLIEGFILKKEGFLECDDCSVDRGFDNSLLLRDNTEESIVVGVVVGVVVDVVITFSEVFFVLVVVFLLLVITVFILLEEERNSILFK